MADFITGTLVAKLITGLGGLVGGVSFMMFYTPRNVWDAAIRSGLSVITAIVFTPTLIDWLEIDVTTNNSVACAAVIGFCSWSILSLIARTMVRIQDERTTVRMPNFLDRRRNNKR